MIYSWNLTLWKIRARLDAFLRLTFWDWISDILYRPYRLVSRDYGACVSILSWKMWLRTVGWKGRYPALPVPLHNIDKSKSITTQVLFKFIVICEMLTHKASKIFTETDTSGLYLESPSSQQKLHSLYALTPNSMKGMLWLKVTR
jgi:hypothetical protein